MSDADITPEDSESDPGEQDGPDLAEQSQIQQDLALSLEEFEGGIQG